VTGNASRLLLIAAVAAIPSPLGAQPKPFSHKLHLSLNLACTVCHEGAATSASASDNNLPAPAVCRRCHDKPMPIKAPGKTIVTRFSHELHLKLGNVAPVIAAAIDAGAYHLSTDGKPPPAALRASLKTGNACAACHRGLDQSVQVTPEAFPAMQDCLVCHPKIDPPFSCEKCHEPGKHLQPASHVSHYIDIHSTGKANLNKPSCAVCHGRKFTCLGCH